MKKPYTFIVISVLLLAICMAPGCRSGRSGSVAASDAPAGVFSGYDAVEVTTFKIKTNTAAPDASGKQLADKIVFQIRRYSQKKNLFNSIIRQGTQKAPAGSNVLVIAGQVTEYSSPSLGSRIGRSFIPGGEFTGTAAFAAHYQFLDKKSGKVIHETDLRTTSTGSTDTVDYAMERNAEAVARIVAKQK